MHEKINQIPRGAEWKTASFFFPDDPEERHTLRYKHILEAITDLWCEPALADHFVYRPRKAWTDRHRKKRIYNEMWTGLWWEYVQVRQIFFALFLEDLK